MAIIAQHIKYVNCKRKAVCFLSELACRFSQIFTLQLSWKHFWKTNDAFIDLTGFGRNIERICIN